MSVRFTLVDRQLKLFKHGLQSLQKIGSELLLEALPARVVLRSINSSLSAYLSVTYNANFFDSYDVLDCTVVQAGLLMKHVMSVFRTQRVTKILFHLDTATCKATVTLHCENGLVKSYRLPTMDSEILQATVDKRQFAVRLTAEAPSIARLLASFHGGLEEITLVALPEGSHRPVHVNSFIDPQKGHVDKSLYTSVQVEPADAFLTYVNSADEATDVTVNLKDFKAMMGLCESLGTHIKLSFDSPGNPLVAEPHFAHAHGHGQGVDYEAELILSTLMESHAGGAADAAAAAAAAAGRGERMGIDGAGAGQGGMGGGGLHTPGGIEIDSPAGDGRPAGGGSGSGGSGSGGSGRPGSGRAGELGLSPAPGLSGRTLPGATLARPTSAAAAAAAGQSRFAQEAQQHTGQDMGQQQQQQPHMGQHRQQPHMGQLLVAQEDQQHQQQGQPPPQQQRQRPSGLVDNGSLWVSGDQQNQQQQRSMLNPLGGDAGPFFTEQAEVAWGQDDMEEGGAVPSSPPQAPMPMSTLPPGAIM